MKPVFQTRYGEKNGNCFQAAIASLFELDLDDVPDFCNVFDTETDEWYCQFVLWLNKMGFSSLPVELDDLRHPNFKNCYLLVGGKNSDGVNHAVIYKNGKVVHDPNKNGTEIKPEIVDLIFAMDPSKLGFTKDDGNN